MVKHRLEKPYDFFWFDDFEHLHRCKYLKCEECACEKTVIGSLKDLERFPDEVDFGVIVAIIKYFVKGGSTWDQHH